MYPASVFHWSGLLHHGQIIDLPAHASRIVARWRPSWSKSEVRSLALDAARLSGGHAGYRRTRSEGPPPLHNYRLIATVRQSPRCSASFDFQLTPSRNTPTSSAGLKSSLNKPTKAPFRIFRWVHHPIFQNGRHADTADFVYDWDYHCAEKVHASSRRFTITTCSISSRGHPTSFVCSGAGADLYDLEDRRKAAVQILLPAASRLYRISKPHPHISPSASA